MRSLSTARHRQALLSAVVIAAGLVSSARAAEAPAGPVTLGPDLSKYSDNNQFGCSSNPFTGAPTGALTCTWASTNIENPTPLAMFGPGQISQITIKVGAITGPMKAVVIRGESSFNLNEPESQSSSSCCTDIGESQTFTPSANTTTTVPVDLPVGLEESANPGTGRLDLSYALLGLSPAEADVPVPAATGVHETIESPSFVEGPEEEPIETGQTHSEEISPTTLLEQPAMQMGAPPQTPQTGKGVLVLMDATFTPTPGASTVTSIVSSFFAASGSGPGKINLPTGPSPLHPSAGLPAASTGFPVQDRSVHIAGPNAVVELTCTATDSPCAGTVRLQSASSNPPKPSKLASATKRKGKPKRRAPADYGTGKFRLAPGGSGSVPIRLSALGMRLAHRHRTRKIWVLVKVNTPKPVGSRAGMFTVRF